MPFLNFIFFGKEFYNDSQYNNEQKRIMIKPFIKTKIQKYKLIKQINEDSTIDNSIKKNIIKFINSIKVTGGSRKRKTIWRKTFRR
jgi:predicted HAD superfamily phosphohydrolase